MEFQDAGGNSSRLKDASRPCRVTIASAVGPDAPPLPSLCDPFAMIYPTTVRMRPLSPIPMAAAEAHPQVPISSHTAPPSAPIGPRPHAIPVNSAAATPRPPTETAPSAPAENTTSQPYTPEILLRISPGTQRGRVRRPIEWRRYRVLKSKTVPYRLYRCIKSKV